MIWAASFLGAIALVAVVYAMVGRYIAGGKAARSPIPGYLGDVAQLREEYLKFYGRALDESTDIEEHFSAAGQFMYRRDFVGAAAELDRLASQAAVPLVFNDLGLMYSHLNDRTHAANAFRQALMRDPGYRPVRSSMQLTNCQSCEPLTREVEPNDLPANANLIPIDTQVDADINSSSDVDWFEFVTPATPRDLVAIEFTNPSTTLALAMHVYDSGMRLTDIGKDAAGRGDSISRQFSPERNATFFIQVTSMRGSVGQYVLTVHPRRAFDAYEPNDDILSARKIALGETLTANIMDAQDRDYYWFEKPEAGTATIAIRGQSDTLLPALSTFGPDAHSIDLDLIPLRGESEIKHALIVRAHQKYYLQVSGREQSSGKYTLRVD
jgi:hypothetical protein